MNNSHEKEQQQQQQTYTLPIAIPFLTSYSLSLTHTVVRFGMKRK